MWVLAVVLATLPLGAAAWKYKGTVEPDTPHDFGWMWEEPDQGSDSGGVYFNSFVAIGKSSHVDFASSFKGGVIKYLPRPLWPILSQPILFEDHKPWTHNALVGSGVAPTGSISMRAILGVWKDCNLDGFVGLATTGTLDYSSVFLPPESPCWGTRHVGSSVREFFPTTDPEARVWGDFGKPGDPPVYHCHKDRSLSVHTFWSTGGLLRDVDCGMAYSISLWLSQNDRTDADKTDNKGGALSFDDPYQPEQDCDGSTAAGTTFHPLNQDLIWGSPYDCDEAANIWEDTEGEATLTVWDCDRGQTNVGDIIFLPGLTPRVSSRGVGSAYETVFDLAENGSRCRNAVQGLWPWVMFLAVMTQSKTWGTGAWAVLLPFTSAGLPHPDDPKRSADFLLGSAGNEWIQRHPKDSVVAPDYMGGTVQRGTIGEPAGPLWFTAYAHVGPETLCCYRVPPFTGVYGSEACQGRSLGTWGGWDCDRENWWTDPGASAAASIGPRPGDPYRFRDVDCYDGRLYSGASDVVPESIGGIVPPEAWGHVPDGRDSLAPKASLAAVSEEPPCPRAEFPS